MAGKNIGGAIIALFRAFLLPSGDVLILTEEFSDEEIVTESAKQKLTQGMSVMMVRRIITATLIYKDYDLVKDDLAYYKTHGEDRGELDQIETVNAIKVSLPKS